MTTAIRSLNIVLGMLLLLSPLTLSQGTGTSSDCHPFPGAGAQDCLELIGNNLGNDTSLACGSVGSATITLRTCSIITKCGPGVMTVVPDEAVRGALTTIGKCAFSDRGSISGYYTASDDSKTCYLYAGQ
jgi:hypothetical protein